MKKKEAASDLLVKSLLFSFEIQIELCTRFPVKLNSLKCDCKYTRQKSREIRRKMKGDREGVEGVEQNWWLSI